MSKRTQLLIQNKPLAVCTKILFLLIKTKNKYFTKQTKIAKNGKVCVQLEKKNFRSKELVNARIANRTLTYTVILHLKSIIRLCKTMWYQLSFITFYINAASIKNNFDKKSQITKKN